MLKQSSTDAAGIFGNLSPETKAHIDRLFAGQASAASGSSGGSRGIGGALKSLATGVPALPIAKSIPGIAVLLDLLRANTAHAKGKIDLPGIEAQKLQQPYAQQALSNLTSPGTSLLSYFGGNDSTPLAAISPAAPALARGSAEAIRSTANVQRNPKAVGSIDRALQRDAARASQTRVQLMDQQRALQGQHKALEGELGKLFTDPRQVFSQRLRSTPPAELMMPGSPLFGAVSAQHFTPSRLGNLGRLAALGSPFTLSPARATGAALNQASVNRSLKPRADQLRVQLGQLAGRIGELNPQIDSALGTINKSYAHRRALTQTPFDRLTQNLRNMFQPEAQSKF